MLPRYADHEQQRLEGPDRQRAIGAGHPFELNERDHILLTVMWLRVYPTHEVVGYLFGASDSTVSRLIGRVLPILEQAGRDTMRMPDPGKKRRRSLDDLLQDTPELAVVIDSFEQRVQRPRDRDEADRYYSGKNKQHTLKSQVAVDETTSQVADVADSVRGPTADLKLLEQSRLLDRLPPGVGGMAIWPTLGRLIHDYYRDAAYRKILLARGFWGAGQHRSVIDIQFFNTAGCNIDHAFSNIGDQIPDAFQLLCGS